jgi:hypothetical protein
MTMTKYRNHKIIKTNTTTDTPNGVRCVYRIEGEHGKAAEVRPFLTTVAAAREYIANRVTPMPAE